MRKICYSVATSLDGFIAGPNGETDWIVMDPEIDFAGLWARFDTLLMGRRTYETAVKRLGGFAFQGKQVLVASRSWRSEDHPGINLLPDLHASTIRALRATGLKDIWLMGGGGLFTSLLDMGEIEQVEVMILPVLLGAGVPLVKRLENRAELVLQDHRMFGSGLVTLRYAVKR